MASRRRRRGSDQFRCSMCLEVFTDPVSIPCGHTFCKTCLSQAWNSAPYRCSLCNEVFNTKPELKTNTFIEEMVSQFRRESTHQTNVPESTPGSGTVLKVALVLTLLCVAVFWYNFTARALADTEKRLREEFKAFAARALADTEKRLREEFKKLPAKIKLHKIHQFAVDLTLDPDTAYPSLVLSKDLKQVHRSGVWNKLPYSPLRFDYCGNVLSKQSFFSGRFYFEVQVKGNTEWDLGVAQESINRKGQIILCPNYGYWTIWLKNGAYEALACPSVRLSPVRPLQTVGVFVDYSEGAVSFYDADSADLLYSFTGFTFRGRLLMFLSPSINEGGANSSPLVITPV